MSLTEDLSRLLSGELSPDDAAAMEARIASEPKVAAAWEDLQSVIEDLQTLPESAPPPELDARVLGGKPVRARRGWPMWIAPVALAATAVLWLGLRLPTPDRVALVEGDQVVQGRVEVVAGNLMVEVNGLARISVEPGTLLVRATPAEEEPMNAALSALGGAAAGAVVTVAVLQGSALIHDADGSTHRLAEGETHTVAPPEGQQKVHIQLPQAPAGETPAQAIARLEATVTALTDKLSSSQFTGAVAQGQLVAHVGTAQEWPEDIDEGFREASMAARVDKILAEHEGVELAEMDCSEYPCITVFRPTDPSEGWEQRLRPVAEAMSEGFEDVGLSVFASNNGNEDKQSSLMGVTVAPSGDNGRDSDVGARMHYRADTLLQELSQAELDAQD